MRWRRFLLPKKKAELVYYMVTAAGLHVGQHAPGGLLGRGVADYFLPREAIVGSDSDYHGAVDFHLADGEKVLLVFSDGFPQHADHYLHKEKSAGAQAETVSVALGWPHRA